MKVLFVNENIGGHATVHYHLGRVLAERDDVTATFLSVPAPGLLRRAVGASVPGLGRLDLDLQPLRAQLAASAWVARRLRQAATGVDAIHLYTHNAGLLSARALAAQPTVVTLDTTNACNAYRLPYRSPTRFTPVTVAATRPFERRVYDAAATVVANSEWAATSLRVDYGIDERKLVVLPFGIVPPPFEPAAAPGVDHIDRPRIVFIGRQLERKGGLRLLRLYQQHLVDRAELVMVTKEPVPSGRGITVVDDLDQGDDRLWDLLRSAALFVFPSEIDQAPNVVLEAMAAGLPVVATRTAAIPEMVADGESGMLVDPGDDAGLRRAVERLLESAAERRRMGECGRARVLARYDAHRAVDELLGLLRDAIEARGAVPGAAGC